MPLADTLVFYIMSDIYTMSYISVSYKSARLIVRKITKKSDRSTLSQVMHEILLPVTKATNSFVIFLNVF